MKAHAILRMYSITLVITNHVCVLTLHLLGLPVALSSDPSNAVPLYCYGHRLKPKAADIARTVDISVLGLLRWRALGYFLEKVPRESK